jgi:hypothetical protein
MLLQVIECLLLGHAPNFFFLTSTPCYLDEGLCDMRESQHEPAIEIGKAQEALKLSECGWDWLVTDDLDIGGIHIHTMTINDVS